MIIEVCAGSLEDCLTAQKSGADRIELVSALFLGGLTPSLAVVAKAKKQVSIPIIAMIRPRGAGFVYSEIDKEVMFGDAKLFLEYGVDGLAFGFLTEQGEIDEVNTKRMIDLCHEYGKEAVFHRAIDCTHSLKKSVELLIDLGCDRILTSGGQQGAPQGAANIQVLQETYGDKITILAGAGINADNVEELVKQSKVTQIHTGAKQWLEDATTTNGVVSYAYSDTGDYEVVSYDNLKALVDKVRKF